MTRLQDDRGVARLLERAIADRTASVSPAMTVIFGEFLLVR